MASDTEDEVLIGESNDARHREQPTVDQTEFSSYYSATVFMFALGSTGVAFAIVPVLLFTDNISFSTAKSIHFLLEMIFLLVLICLCVFLVLYKRRAITRGSWTHDDTSMRSWLVRSSVHDGETHTKYMMFTLLLFGIGSVVWCVIKIAEIPTKIWFIIDKGLNMLSLVCQLVFFYEYVGEKLPNVPILHYSISAMIDIHITSWVGAVIEPLWDVNSTVSDDLDGEYIFEFSEGFFEPFYIEFSTIAIGVLFSIWHSMKKGTRLQPSGAGLDGVPYDLDHYDPEEASVKRANRPRNGPNLNKKTIFLSVFIAVAFTGVSILATLSGVFGDSIARIYVLRGVIILVFTPLIILAIVLLFKLNSIPSRASSFLNTSEFVLLFTASSESIYYILRALAAIGYLLITENHSDPQPTQTPNFTSCFTASDVTINTSSIYDLTIKTDHLETGNTIAVLFLAYSVVKVTQVWLQSRLLIVASRKHLPDYVRSCLTFMVAVNFGEWLRKGVFLGHFQRSCFNPMMLEFYGSVETINIILIFDPIGILFHFHAAIMALEIIIES